MPVPTVVKDLPAESPQKTIVQSVAREVGTVSDRPKGSYVRLLQQGCVVLLA